MASSTELSTTSQTRWWRPVGPVDPMYMPGPLADRLETLEDGDVARRRRNSRGRRLRSSSVFSATGAPFHSGVSIGERRRAPGAVALRAQAGRARRFRCRIQRTEGGPSPAMGRPGDPGHPVPTGSRDRSSDLEPVEPACPATSATPVQDVGAEVTDLGGPGRVVRLDDQGGRRSSAHRADVGGHGRADDVVPAGEHRAQMPARPAPSAAAAPETGVERPASSVPGRGRRPAAAVTGSTPGGGRDAQPMPAGSTVVRPRPAAPPGGGGTAVVRSAWPAGSPASSARARSGSSSENTSSRRRTGAVPRRSVASWWAARRRARASDRCSPWEAWVRAGRPPMREVQVVAVRPHGGHPPAEVVGAGGQQGVGQRAVPGRAGRRASTAHLGRRPGGRSARSPPGASSLGQRLSGRDQGLAGGGQPGVPHVEGGGHLGLRPPAGLAQQGAPAGGGCARPPSAQRVERGSTTARASSRYRRRSAGPPWTRPRSSGVNTVTSAGPRAGPRGAAPVWRLTMDPGPAGRGELGLDQQGAVAHHRLGPDDGAAGRRPRTRASRGRAPERPEGGQVATASSRLVLPAPLRRDHRQALGVGVNSAAAIVAEVGEPQRGDVPRCVGGHRRSS